MPVRRRPFRRFRRGSDVDALARDRMLALAGIITPHTVAVEPAPVIVEDLPVDDEDNEVLEDEEEDLDEDDLDEEEGQEDDGPTVETPEPRSVLDGEARGRLLHLIGPEFRLREAGNTGLGTGGTGASQNPQDQSKHPHAPKGQHNGGQFAKAGGAPTKTVAKAAAKAAPPQSTPQPPATPRTMKQGNSGEDVRYAQYAMSLLGFKVNQSGSYDQATADTVKQIQARLGVAKPNGKLSSSQLKKLQDAVRLSPCVGSSRDLAYEADVEERGLLLEDPTDEEADEDVEEDLDDEGDPDVEPEAADPAQAEELGDDALARHRNLTLLGIEVRAVPDDTLDDIGQAVVDALEDWVERQVEGDWEVRGDVSKELRIPGGKGGGRWTANPIGKAISDALDAWGKGDGPEDPFHFDGKPIDREPLRKAAVARGITLKRGASRDDIVKALLGGAKDDVVTQRAERQKRLGSAKFSVDHGGKRIDVAVYTDQLTGKKAILREVSTSGRPGRVVTSQPDLAGLEKWAGDNGHADVADWARSEQGAGKAPAKAVSQTGHVAVDAQARAGWKPGDKLTHRSKGVVTYIGPDKQDSSGVGSPSGAQWVAFSSGQEGMVSADLLSGYVPPAPSQRAPTPARKEIPSAIGLLPGVKTGDTAHWNPGHGEEPLTGKVTRRGSKMWVNWDGGRREQLDPTDSSVTFEPAAKATKAVPGAAKKAAAPAKAAKAAAPKAAVPKAPASILTKVKARRSELIGKAGRSSIRGNNPAAEEVARMQGFDAKPKVGDAAAVDAVIAAGGTELFRGGPPAGIDAMRTGDMHYGGGFFGSGYYSSIGRNAPETFAGARGDDAPGEGAVVRMALAPDAKVADFDDIQTRYDAFAAKDPQLAKAIDSSGYAAMLGYDAIRVPAKHGDGTSNPVDQLVVLNRSKLTMDSAQERFAAGDLLSDQDFAEMTKRWKPEDVAKAKADRAASQARRAAQAGGAGPKGEAVRAAAHDVSGEVRLPHGPGGGRWGRLVSDVKQIGQGVKEFREDLAAMWRDDPTSTPASAEEHEVRAIADRTSTDLQAITGRPVHVDLSGLSPAVAQGYSDGLTAAAKAAPGTRLDRVETYGPGGVRPVSSEAAHVPTHEWVAYATPGRASHEIHFNTAPNIAKVQRTADGYLAVPTAQGVAAHEFGHLATVDPAIQAAAWAAAQARPLDEPLPSRYSQVSVKEFMADAFADATLNGDSAGRLSKQILDIVQTHQAQP